MECQLTIPRELSLDENLNLISKPLAELTQLRTDTVDFGAFDMGVNDTFVLGEDLSPVEIEAEFDLDATTSDRIGFLVHKTSGCSHTFVGYDDLAGTVFIDRRLTGNGDRGYRAVQLRGSKLKLRIFVDQGSIEIFANDGEETLTSLSFPNAGPRSIEITSESGTIAVSSLKMHKLATIWETPDR